MTDKTPHQWAATGVSSYPLSHPIVGQGQFFNSFQHFIHLIEGEGEKFAHVFGVIAQWGVGKSRLGYEVVAQINDTSRGWWVRGEDGSLTPANLFRDPQDREQYLGLYIRYSQIANDYKNTDNWFAYGLYKALLPLARGAADESIQGRIANEASDRLIVAGFEPAKLAAALEVSANHSDQSLYEDPTLATRLCEEAYKYLKTLGIKYVVVVLDELETAAEAATYGLNSGDLKHLDGFAIKLIGKAIKEEDPKRKLPWLRYVALCSPAIGDELRNIQSTHRRLEWVELQPNAFADVSDFVQTLKDEGRLPESYPEGLVEAAYAMSAGNFGWFNVVMASVDERLRDRRRRGEHEAPTVGALFDEVVSVSTRVQQHVLDHNAIEHLKLSDRARLTTVRDMLYGQLPVGLDTYPPATRQVLLDGRNEYDEPIATLFRRVEWDDVEAAEALRASKFVRDKGVWRLGGVDQPLDLRQLMSNLATYAIHETKGRRRSDGNTLLVVPLRESEFIQLVTVLYPHPAAEDAARALWRKFLGTDDLAPDTATHIGPSVEMIERLDLRHRKRGQGAIVFREPDQNAAHERVLAGLRAQTDQERARQVLVGAMRLFDRNWAYDLVAPGIRDSAVTAIATAASGRGGGGGGLVTCHALNLHPKGRAIFAWVKNVDELVRLCSAASSQFDQEGRTPVVAFTPSRAVVDALANPPNDTLKGAQGYVLAYQLSAAEEFMLHQTGVKTADCAGFRLDGHGFSSAFNARLNTLEHSFLEEVGLFRKQLNELGRIAWPFRPAGRFATNASDYLLLIQAWRVLAIDTPPPASFANLDERSGVDVEALKGVLSKLGITPTARSAGYTDNERAMLFNRLDDSAEPIFPPFLIGVITSLLKREWTYKLAEREWFWGYCWEAARPKETYTQWMALVCELGFGKPRADAAETYTAISRAELRNAVQEADNWLKNEYPSLVADMEAVFGAGRVQELFCPEGKPQPGTKTLLARQKLTASSTDVAGLDAEEPGAIAEEVIRTASLRRRRVMENVHWVYHRDDYQALQQDPNVRTLDFESDSSPLWQRIRRAALFVDFVRRAESSMTARTESLANEMRSEAATVQAFPISLFTLSLEKIKHILEGALAVGPAPGATVVTQATEPGTLRQNLRDLRIADAREQLEKLAKELGIDLTMWVESSIADIDGQIVATFHELRTAFADISNGLDAVADRVHKLEKVLADPPDDFTYPPATLSLDKLRTRHDHIKSSLDTVRGEDMDRLRDEFDAPARHGNFQPLMDRARQIVDEPRAALTQLVANVMSVENAVADYRQRLLKTPMLHKTHRGVTAIDDAKGRPATNGLTSQAIENAGPLKAAKQMVVDTVRGFEAVMERDLAPAGVSAARWIEIVGDVDGNRDPAIEAPEADGLVREGLMRRTYQLGRRT